MNFPIIDSHIHLWDKNHLNYPWLEHYPDLNESFLLSDLMDATKALHLESFVVVQSECDRAQSLEEVEWLAKLSQRDARIRGIVAYASLEQGNDVHAYLTVLKAMSPLVKGVRRALLMESADFCLEEKFVAGVKLLAEFNFTFDLCIYPNQLSAALRLVEQCPEVKFVLNHLAMPSIAEKKLQPWQDDLAALAKLPNVWCKLSGLITNANHHTWCFEDLRPYVFHALDVFGIDRVMFGSDWPIVNLAGSYSHWVHTLYDLFSHAPEQDWRKLFYENASNCYGLVPVVVELG